MNKAPFNEDIHKYYRIDKDIFHLKKYKNTSLQSINRHFINKFQRERRVKKTDPYTNAFKSFYLTINQIIFVYISV